MNTLEAASGFCILPKFTIIFKDADWSSQGVIYNYQILIKGQDSYFNFFIFTHFLVFIWQESGFWSLCFSTVLVFTTLQTRYRAFFDKFCQLSTEPVPGSQVVLFLWFLQDTQTFRSVISTVVYSPVYIYTVNCVVILCLCSQAGLSMWRSGVWEEPPLSCFLSRACWMQPAAGPLAVQLCRLQCQIPTPLPLQGLSQRPGGIVQGLPMTRGGPGWWRLFCNPWVGNSLGRDSVIKAAKHTHWLCYLTSDPELATKVGKV